ncbi:MAG: hypothetical protein ACLP50_33835 [Solirubrobacteraceae bacterium]
MRQARLRDNGHAGLYNADAAMLDAGAGLDVRAVLLRNGASAVGTREELNGDTGPARHRIGAHIGQASIHLLPVVAYVLTRVAPVAHRIAV